MQYCDWEDENWDTLIYAIQKNNCILMLGPDAATAEMNGAHRPLTEILANQLAEKITPPKKRELNSSDLAQVSQQYCMEKSRLDLEARATAFYNAKMKQTNALHKNLAALPFYFTVATTPEKMFPEALAMAKKEPVIGSYNFKENKKQKQVTMGTPQKPLVFHLYGTLDVPGSLLLTENDLLDFLVALISKSPPLQDNIRIELQDEKKSFLFLGFGFRHWYLRILLHVLKSRNGESRSFALEQFTPESSAEFQRNVFFFKKSEFKIHIFKQEFNIFAKELREKFERSSPDCIPRFMDVDAPEVFICHASEDKTYAGSLFKRLEKAGIKPWLDKEDLRGGDDWNDRIEKTIKAVDYFVVLQSKALAKKDVGYVNREINKALNRQDDFRKGIRFIIPVRIEECPLREELAYLQTIDLMDEANVQELISTIKRDFERRGS